MLKFIEDKVDSLFVFSGDIVPKPRMTKADTWKKRPVVMKYWQFKDEISRQAKDQDFILPDEFTIKVYIKMPQSWSKKKKESLHMKPHKQRPDLDNILKAVQDCLSTEDCGVWELYASKQWVNSENSYIIIEKLEKDMQENLQIVN